jgi:hypothetical protein
MGVRVGASRRTRWGRVWVSAPLSLVVLVLLLAWPLLVYAWLIKAAVMLVAWGVRQAARRRAVTRQRNRGSRRNLV